MTQEQLDRRKHRAGRELFVISAVEEGWRVRSARTPGTYYTVVKTETGFACTCPDYQNNNEDASWRCTHALAVEQQGKKETNHSTAATPIEQSEPPSTQEASTSIPCGQMLVKRSLSPDGRIDAISIEFTFGIGDESALAIAERALKALDLQTRIVQRFLQAGTTHSNGAASKEGNGAVSGYLLDVGVTQGPYGERFFVNVNVNGQRARLFGTARQIAQALTAAGRGVAVEQIEPGFRINYPCRVLTERSRDGKYLNVTQLLPRGGNGQA